MKNINLNRVVLGGLVAGLFIIFGEYILNGILLGAQFNAQRAKLGLGDPAAGELAVGAVITLVYGIVFIWIYAAIRPRFGPGPRTAVIAGLTFWATAHLLFLASLWTGSMVSSEFAIVSIVWGAFEDPVAALIGAWIYREDELPT